jgi:hypothetical protein
MPTLLMQTPTSAGTIARPIIIRTAILLVAFIITATVHFILRTEAIRQDTRIAVAVGILVRQGAEVTARGNSLGMVV